MPVRRLDAGIGGAGNISSLKWRRNIARRAPIYARRKLRRARRWPALGWARKRAARHEGIVRRSSAAD